MSSASTFRVGNVRTCPTCRTCGVPRNESSSLPISQSFHSYFTGSAYTTHKETERYCSRFYKQCQDLAGRTSGFFKLRGVNINHNELEERLLALDDVSDYLVTALIEDDREILRIEVETHPGVSE